MIVELFDLQDADAPDELMNKLLLTKLPSMPVERFYLLIAPEPRLRHIADALAANPADRTTLEGWATRVALSLSGNS